MDNTKKMAQKTFLFVLKNLCNVDEYRHAFTYEQKLEVLTKMRHIFGICLGMTLHQIADLKEKNK